MEADNIGHFVLAFFMGGLICSQSMDIDFLWRVMFYMGR